VTQLTYLVHGAVLLEKLNDFQLVKKFPTFYRSQRFITTFISLLVTTANINENKIVCHKSSTETLLVLNKKVSVALI